MNQIVNKTTLSHLNCVNKKRKEKFVKLLQESDKKAFLRKDLWQFNLSTPFFASHLVF